jgi:hypothetical protein
MEGARSYEATGATTRGKKMMGVNLWTILLAALSAFALGGVWYSNALFRRPWQQAAGPDDARLQRRNPALIFGGSFVLSLIAAFVFALFLGPRPSLALGLGAGASAGLCWVASSFAINYLFERRHPVLLLINGGYHTLQFTLYGFILAVWR